MATETTTIRADTEWLADVDMWASDHGLSRTGAIHVLVRLAMRALEATWISAEQMERLIADE